MSNNRYYLLSDENEVYYSNTVQKKGNNIKMRSKNNLVNKDHKESYLSKLRSEKDLIDEPKENLEKEKEIMYPSDIKNKFENINDNNLLEFEKGWIIIQGNKKNTKIKRYECPPSNKYNVKMRLKDRLLISNRQYYISLYGVDKYNDMFISPYHDYNYFNRKISENQTKKMNEENAIKKCKCLFLNNRYRTEHLPYKLLENYEIIDNLDETDLNTVGEDKYNSDTDSDTDITTLPVNDI